MGCPCLGWGHANSKTKASRELGSLRYKGSEWDLFSSISQPVHPLLLGINIRIEMKKKKV
jgi:hypothetical protein